MGQVMTIITIIVIIASLSWSVGVLIFGLIKRIRYGRKLKKAQKEVLKDDDDGYGKTE